MAIGGNTALDPFRPGDQAQPGGVPRVQGPAILVVANRPRPTAGRVNRSAKSVAETTPAIVTKSCRQHPLAISDDGTAGAVQQRLILRGSPCWAVPHTEG